MRFYCCNKVDNQGRFCLTGYFEPGTKVVFYMESDDGLVYVVPYKKEDKDVPANLARKVDEKCRIVIPKEFHKGHKRAWIASCSNGVALKFVD